MILSPAGKIVKSATKLIKEMTLPKPVFVRGGGVNYTINRKKYYI
jgi:TPP-dependent trihydroxycyclohexane-1,2-dione (THcHDO) dehydratase